MVEEGGGSDWAGCVFGLSESGLDWELEGSRVAGEDGASAIEEERDRRINLVKLSNYFYLFLDFFSSSFSCLICVFSFSKLCILQIQCYINMSSICPRLGRKERIFLNK